MPMPITPIQIRRTSYSYQDLSSKFLIDPCCQSPREAVSDTSDECELKDFFLSLYSFKPAPDEVLSPTSSDDFESSSLGSTVESEDEVQSIFALDKDSYDFESQLPSSTVTAIQEMLEGPDVYDSRFGARHRQLNPHAAPFVPRQQLTQSIPYSCLPLPSTVRVTGSVDSSSSSSPLLPPPKSFKVKPAWMTIFYSTSSTPTDSPILAERAMELAHSHFWNSGALAELAQHFCWKASAVDADVDRKAMAPFTWEVCRALRVAFDQDTANSFVWHLRESLLGTFKGCWYASEKSNSRAISYRSEPSEEYVASAFWLTAFIGDLFVFDLIRVQHIKLCLNVLVHELIFLEHITAISILIEHAGPRFWCCPGRIANSMKTTPSIKSKKPNREMIELFLKNFLPKTMMLQSGSSVLARTVVAGSLEKDKKVQEILDIVTHWCPDLGVLRYQRCSLSVH